MFSLVDCAIYRKLELLASLLVIYLHFSEILAYFENTYNLDESLFTALKGNLRQILVIIKEEKNMFSLIQFVSYCIFIPDSRQNNYALFNSNHITQSSQTDPNYYDILHQMRVCSTSVPTDCASLSFSTMATQLVSTLTSLFWLDSSRYVLFMSTLTS